MSKDNLPVEYLRNATSTVKVPTELDNMSSHSTGTMLADTYALTPCTCQCSAPLQCMDKVRNSIMIDAGCVPTRAGAGSSIDTAPVFGEAGRPLCALPNSGEVSTDTCDVF
jgi:hypothetical protein